MDGTDLSVRAVELARSFRPHIAIVDLRLHDNYQDERSGLALLKELDSAHCILYSAYMTPEITREAHNRSHFVEWVDKAENPQHLVDILNETARCCCAGRRPLKLRGWASDVSEQIARRLFKDDAAERANDVDDVLRQLFTEQREITLELLDDQETHSPAAARGHSVVLKVESESRLPVIVKLAPAERIRRERQRYDRHVLDQVAGYFHAVLIRDVVFWDLGGAVYDFVGSPRKGLPTFSTFYRHETDSRAILVPLRYFFEMAWSRYYEYPSIKQPVSLLDLYDTSSYLKHKLRKVSFEESLAELSASFGVSLIDPMAWVLGRAREAPILMIRQAITHGDLNGDNLFVDGEHAWAIDFERTGPGHILRDFIELETDIITRLTPLPAENPNLLRDFVIAVASPDELATTPLAAQFLWEQPGDLQSARSHRRRCVIWHTILPVVPMLGSTSGGCCSMPCLWRH